MAKRTVLERLRDRYVVTESGCWQWTGQVSNMGYGVMSVANMKRLAHRLMYEALVGPIPDGLELDHLCRNTRCVNPAHLEPVTHSENMRRGRTIAARNAAVTHCPAGHAYDETNTYRSPQGKRRCRDCARVRDRARVPRRR